MIVHKKLKNGKTACGLPIQPLPHYYATPEQRARYLAEELSMRGIEDKGEYMHFQFRWVNCRQCLANQGYRANQC